MVVYQLYYSYYQWLSIALSKGIYFLNDLYYLWASSAACLLIRVLCHMNILSYVIRASWLSLSRADADLSTVSLSYSSHMHEARHPHSRLCTGLCYTSSSWLTHTCKRAASWVPLFRLPSCLGQWVGTELCVMILLMKFHCWISFGPDISQWCLCLSARIVRKQIYAANFKGSVW